MAFFKILTILALFLNFSSAARILSSSEQDTMHFKYHNGPLLSGKIAINLIWYGRFKPSQKATIVDFIVSLQSGPITTSQPRPSVQTWWKITDQYYNSVKLENHPSSLHLSLGKQISDYSYSLGKSLTMQQVQLLAAKGGPSHAINVVLTSSDVAVEGFCSSRCGTHGSVSSGKNQKFVYVWVGNSETQCPGQCAWPFHQPIYGPQGPPLIAPNNDVGLDGIVINLSGLLAGSVSNPFGNGFYQGPSGAPLEAASACSGIYGKGAYPGYAGDLLVDPTTGASYNAHGVNGRKYLLPALYDPSTKSCSTLI